MLKKIRLLLLGLVIGMLLGLWFGINIGKGRPIWSNPFDKSAVQKRLKKESGELLEKGGKVLEKSGKKLLEE